MVSAQVASTIADQIGELGISERTGRPISLGISQMEILVILRSMVRALAPVSTSTGVAPRHCLEALSTGPGAWACPKRGSHVDGHSCIPNAGDHLTALIDFIKLHNIVLRVPWPSSSACHLATILVSAREHRLELVHQLEPLLKRRDLIVLESEETEELAPPWNHPLQIRHFSTHALLAPDHRDAILEHEKASLENLLHHVVHIFGILQIHGKTQLLPLRSHRLGRLFILHSEPHQQLTPKMPIEGDPILIAHRSRPALLVEDLPLSGSHDSLEPSLRSPPKRLLEQPDEVRPFSHFVQTHLLLKRLNFHDDCHVIFILSDCHQLRIGLELSVVPLFLLGRRIRHQSLMELLCLLSENHQARNDLFLRRRPGSCRNAVRRCSTSHVSIAGRAQTRRPHRRPQWSAAWQVPIPGRTQGGPSRRSWRLRHARSEVLPGALALPPRVNLHQRVTRAWRSQHGGSARLYACPNVTFGSNGRSRSSHRVVNVDRRGLKLLTILRPGSPIPAGHSIREAAKPQSERARPRLPGQLHRHRPRGRSVGAGTEPPQVSPPLAFIRPGRLDLADTIGAVSCLQSCLDFSLQHTLLHPRVLTDDSGADSGARCPWRGDTLALLWIPQFVLANGAQAGLSCSTLGLFGPIVKACSLLRPTTSRAQTTRHRIDPDHVLPARHVCYLVTAQSSAARPLNSIGD